VATDGVVAVQPAEEFQPGLALAGPALSFLEHLAFQCRVEALGRGVGVIRRLLRFRTLETKAGCG
jgi:hypothetical protein